MRDRETQSVWNHIDGKAFQGPLTGKRLRMIPLLQTTWGAWLNANRATTILSSDTPYQDRYREPQIGLFSYDETQYGDDRLPSNTLIVGVEVNETYKGYTLQAIVNAGGVFNDEIGGEPVVVAYDETTGTGIAYNRRIGDQVIFFETATGPNGILLLKDAETGSLWDLSGNGFVGSLSNDHDLVFVPSIISEWYGWSAYHPQTELFASE